MTNITQFSFTINHWQHLYSLQQAVEYNKQISGQTIEIKGRVLNQPFLQHHDTPISLFFQQANEVPQYKQTPSGQTILGNLEFIQQQLRGNIKIDRRVFEELRKNLLEYAEIDGIHIVCSLGVLKETDEWQDGESFSLLQMDYAMKGDA